MYQTNISRDQAPMWKTQQITLQEIRKRANMTQTDLAYAAHVSIDLIKAIEYGSMPFGKVDLEKAIGIARALRIDVEDFLYGSKLNE